MDSRSVQSRADRLLARVLSNIDGSACNGVVLNDLLEEFYRGFPVERVLPLLESDVASVARAGAWIASQLGSRSCGVFAALKHYLDCDDPPVRLSIADCVLVCATRKDADSIARVARFLEDPEARVRWKGIDTLTKMSSEQISAGADFCLENDSTGRFSNGMNLLTAADSTPESFRQAFVPSLTADPIAKKFWFIAAVRARAPRSELERIAISSKDRDIRDFLEDFEKT